MVREDLLMKRGIVLYTKLGEFIFVNKIREMEKLKTLKTPLIKILSFPFHLILHTKLIHLAQTKYLCDSPLPLLSPTANHHK
jgi:hypothetical protein